MFLLVYLPLYCYSTLDTDNPFQYTGIDRDHRKSRSNLCTRHLCTHLNHCCRFCCQACVQRWDTNYYLGYNKSIVSVALKMLPVTLVGKVNHQTCEPFVKKCEICGSPRRFLREISICLIGSKLQILKRYTILCYWQPRFLLDHRVRHIY